jgi:hypothetical protein
MIKVKTFLNALNLIATNPKKAKTFLKDKRLTLTEKTILGCWMSLRDNRNDSLIERLSELSASPDPVIESQRLLLLGIAYINVSNPNEAIPQIESSLSLLEHLELPDFKFQAANNLFIAHLNLKNKKGMIRALEIQKSIKPIPEFRKNSLLLNQFNYYKFVGNLETARIINQELDRRKKTMTENQLIQYCLSSFDLGIKQGNLEACARHLSELKKLRKFNISPNFKYMRILLDHLQSGRPVYMYSRDFSKHPNLGSQIAVIHHLEAGNRKDALASWRQLSNWNPEVYSGEFQYKGDRSLFSLCLAKHLTPIKDPLKIPIGAQKDEALIQILESAKGPVTKEEIHKLLWGTSTKAKTDLNKLERLVSRVRSNSGLSIISRKGTYFLVRK